MNLVCDEGVERRIVERLRELGHEVLYVAELDPGIDDPAILAIATELNAPLVTNDMDFGELSIPAATGHERRYPSATGWPVQRGEGKRSDVCTA
ncbi:MAG: DUF5615 family PIN-like protein [Gemmatimonadota bacterium]